MIFAYLILAARKTLYNRNQCTETELGYQTGFQWYEKSKIHLSSLCFFLVPDFLRLNRGNDYGLKITVLDGNIVYARPEKIVTDYVTITNSGNQLDERTGGHTAIHVHSC